MKFFVFLLFVLSLGTSAYGQQLHMIEMSTDNSALGALNFSESGGGGRSKSSDTNLFLGGNYAYKISERVQLGGQATYVNSDREYESYSLLAGAIYNLSDDLTNAFYTSLYAGMSWFHVYQPNIVSGKHQETITGKLAFGKRFALSNINLPNITYSPEISVTRSENTKSESYTNNITVSFIQFSAFF